MDQQNAPNKPLPTAMKRATIGLNVLLQLAAFTLLIGMINYVSFRHFKRWDFSRNQKYALAPLTKNLLAGLKKPVKVVVFFPSAQAIAIDVGSLLKEYEYASDKKISVEIVDPYRNLFRAKELSEKYKFGSNDNIVILDYEGRSKFVNALDMAEIDNSGAMMGQESIVRAFKGEEAITSALLQLTEEKPNKVYFLSGHGEQEPAGQDLITLKTCIDRQNIQLDSLNFNNVEAVPGDASTLVIMGPRADLSERDIKLLSDYWTDHKGRLFLLLSGNIKTARLSQWLANQGITPQEDIVVRTATMLVTENGQLGVRPGTVTKAVGVVPSSGKAVLKDLVGFDLELAQLSQSISVDPAKTAQEKLRVQTLLTTSADYWGETEYNPQDTKAAVKDPEKDHPGPLTLAVAAEKGGIEDPRVKVETARLVLIGNSGFVSNEGVRASESGQDFFINAMNWLLNREQLAGIPPKPKQAVRLSLNENQMGQIALTVMGIIPALVALIGCFAWWKRRH